MKLAESVLAQLGEDNESRIRSLELQRERLKVEKSKLGDSKEDKAEKEELSYQIEKLSDKIDALSESKEKPDKLDVRQIASKFKGVSYGDGPGMAQYKFKSADIAKQYMDALSAAGISYYTFPNEKKAVGVETK